MDGKPIQEPPSHEDNGVSQALDAFQVLQQLADLGI